MVVVETLIIGMAVKAGLATVVGGSVRALWKSRSQRIGTYLMGLYVRESPPEFTSAVRQNLTFSPVKGFRAGVVSNHAHPHEADMRCQATSTISDFIEDFNFRHKDSVFRGRPFVPYKRYDVSTSSRERKFGVDGNRLIYGDADLGSEYRYDPLKPYHVVTMIDVDYYLTDFSRYANNPIMIYTAIPTNISGYHSGTTFRFTSPDTYEEVVAGGAKYESSLWDYTPDLVRIDHKFWGISTGFSVMKVEKISQPATANRYIVSLVPKARMSVPYWLHRFVAWCSGMVYNYGSVEVLQRVSNVQQVGPYLVGRFATNTFKTHNRIVSETVQIRMADSAGPDHIIVPEEVFQAICVQARTAKNFALGDTTRMIDDSLGDKRMVYSKKMLLHDCVRTLVGSSNDVFKLRINYQCVPVGSVRKYDRQNNVKPTMQLAGQPLVADCDVAVAPVRSHMNDVACIAGRLDNVKNTVVPPPIYEQYAEEFVAIVSSDAPNFSNYRNFVKDSRRKYNHLHPVHISKVDEKQDLPNQRARRERDDKHGDDPKQRIEAHQKVEPYVKAGDPRNITTVTTRHTRELSCFAYAASDYLKDRFGPVTGGQGKWMFPGCTPTTIANGVMDFVSKHRGKVIETDYSRFDGTISEWLRVNVEFAIMRSMFAKSYRKKLDKLLAGEINQKATTKHGVKYNTGGSRLSGSPMTTLGNTLINAFIAYCGLRASGMEPEKAMRYVGPKYGDDGIDYDCDDIKKAADDCGLKMKIIRRTNPGEIGFLGRVYPDAQHVNYSYFDVVRALKKIPVVANGAESLMERLERKVSGYLSSDPATPVLSAYCRALQRIYGFTPGRQFRDVLSGERHAAKLRSPWPSAHDTLDCSTTDAAIATQLGLSVEEMVCLDRNLQQVTSLEGLRFLQLEHSLNEESVPSNVHFFDELSPEGGRT